VDGLVLRDFALNAVEETDEILMPVPLHVLGDDRAVEQGLSGISCVGGRLNIMPPWP
jgi:hypothetical protein